MNLPVVNTFGFRLRKAFGGISNKEIAHKLGLTKSAVTNYMNGRTPPSDTLIKISRLTNCSIHWLLTGEGAEDVNIKSAELGRRPDTIMLANIKGGEAKSTSAVMLAHEFATKGYRTLLVDSPSGCCTYLLFKSLLRRYTWENISSDGTTREGDDREFFRTPFKGLDLCTSFDRYKRLLRKEWSDSFRPDLGAQTSKYSIIVLDTRSLTDPFITTDFFLASILTQVYVMIPTSGDYMSQKGVKLTLDHFAEARNVIRSLNLLGVFLVKYNRGQVHLNKLIGILQELAHGKVLNSVVRREAALEEPCSDSIGHIIKPTSRGVIDYRELAGEVLGKIGKVIA